MKKYSIHIIALSILLFQNTWAATYTLPSAKNAVIGDVSYVSPNAGDTLLSLAQHYNLGVNGIDDANPGIQNTTALTPGNYIVVPTRFLLPPLPRKGIIVNLPEMRIYYYPSENSDIVMTFPIGIGKIGKTVPIENTIIARKKVNPTWTPPASIRAFNAEKGINLPRVMPAGPDNPLGPYAIYLGIPTFLMHSTIFPESIGTRASFGCLRMNESDIKEFFPLVEAGLPVTIIDMPTKIGWQGKQLYIEAHAPLEEHNNQSLTSTVKSIENALPSNQVTLVNWQLVAYVAETPDGVPHEVGVKIN